MIKPGTVVDGYRILSRIGEGSYGTVFATENLLTGQRYALKAVSLTGRAGKRELRALSQYRELSHPNLIKIYHAGKTGDVLYYTMDLAEGTLESRHLNPEKLRIAAAKLADALSFLHEKKLLHRDIKPDNLLWVRGEPVLADIGLMVPASGTVSVSGTFAFLPPRVWKEESPPDEQSDLYALAKSFYCLISGNPPHCYPDYRGTISSETSALFRAVLSVCDEDGRIRTPAEFQEKILHPDIAREGMTHKKRYLLYAACLSLLFFLIIAGLLLYGNHVEYSSEKSQPERHPEKQQPVVSKEEHVEVQSELREEARRYAKKKIPMRTLPSGTEYTTMDDIVQREILARQYIEKKTQTK